MKELDKQNLLNNMVGRTAVQFSAGWCNPCKIMSKNIESLSDNLNVNFFKVYVDKYPELSSEFSIKALPTLILFEDGKELKRAVGVKTEKQILEFVK